MSGELHKHVRPRCETRAVEVLYTCSRIQCTYFADLVIFSGKVSALKSRMQYILLQKGRIIGGIYTLQRASAYGNWRRLRPLCFPFRAKGRIAVSCTNSGFRCLRWLILPNRTSGLCRIKIDSSCLPGLLHRQSRRNIVRSRRGTSL